jgi:RND family efflux transporter MFP subunit
MIPYINHSPSRTKPLRIKQAAYFLMTLLAISACSDEAVEKESLNDFHQSASLVNILPEQSYNIARDYLGQVTAKQHTSLSFEYSGKVSKVLADNGDVVKKGQLLAQQDIQLLSYKTAELQAQIAQAKAQIALNKANLSRVKTLINDGYSSKQNLDELNAENQILKAQIDGLNARIQTIDYQREKSALIAPFDGVITKRYISNGEIIAPNMSTFSIIESANMEINVGIPSKVASALVLGQVIRIKIGEQNTQAKLIAIGHQIDSTNRTVPLRLKMIEKLDKTKDFIGQLVRITIEQKINEAGFWIPIDAITDGVRGQWQVFIASTPISTITNSKSNYQLQAATVNVLHTNENSVYVNGIAIKEHQIVSKGVHRYVTGQVITKSAQTLAKSEGIH